MAAHVRARAAAPAPVLRIRLAATCAEAKPLRCLGTHSPVTPGSHQPSYYQARRLMHPNYVRPSRTRFLGREKTRGLLLVNEADVTAREWLFHRWVYDRPAQRLPVWRCST